VRFCWMLRYEKPWQAVLAVLAVLAGYPVHAASHTPSESDRVT